jgi:ABC-2 type transport system ATP-binding protein
VGVLQGGRLVHLQLMSDLRQQRRIRVRFAGDWAPLPALEGLQLSESRDHQIVLNYNGALPPLLDWLARQPVADLQMESLGLAAIYQRYHGVEE